jgi:hypothetical protein
VSGSDLIQRKVRAARWHLSFRFHSAQLNARLRRYNAQLAEAEREITPQGKPVIFFNPSSRIQHMSQNAAFSLLTSWGFRLSGIPVIYYSCERGMLQCQLGAVGNPPPEQPPCGICTPLSRRMFTPILTSHLELPVGGAEAQADLAGWDLDRLAAFTYDDLPLGRLCIPSLQWSLRRYNLEDDLITRGVLRKFVLSAVNVANSFKALLERSSPAAVVAFNGISFPEAVAREVALRRGVHVVTHEVSAMPFSAFFSHHQATAYEMDIPDEFQLDQGDNALLDSYLSTRFKGDFTMGGIRFWPEMKALPASLEDDIQRHAQMVVVFTNVVFDTSQAHANIIFKDIFEWLGLVAEIVGRNPETLFIVRAHPDELRPGKTSNETIESGLASVGANDLPNLVFIPPDMFISSYELISRAKFAMVYNSSIGLEASIMGCPVLAGGQSRYTHYPTVHIPETPEAYARSAHEWLRAPGDLPITEDFVSEARRFMFFHLFRASLDFSPFLRLRRDLPGSVIFRDFEIHDLHPARCEEVNLIKEGVLNKKPFVYPDAVRWRKTLAPGDA